MSFTLSERRFGAFNPTTARTAAGVLDSVVAMLFAWRRRAVERRMLAEMNDRTLADIGLTRGDVWVETRKPFWRS